MLHPSPLNSLHLTPPLAHLGGELGGGGKGVVDGGVCQVVRQVGDWPLAGHDGLCVQSVGRVGGCVCVSSNLGVAAGLRGFLCHSPTRERQSAACTSLATD